MWARIPAMFKESSGSKWRRGCSLQVILGGFSVQILNDVLSEKSIHSGRTPASCRYSIRLQSYYKNCAEVPTL